MDAAEKSALFRVIYAGVQHFHRVRLTARPEHKDFYWHMIIVGEKHMEELGYTGPFHTLEQERREVR